MASVISIGIAVLDYIFAVDAMPSRPEKFRARDMAIAGGGLAATAAVAVARLGGRSELITRLGMDAAAKEILSELKRCGVRTARSRRFPGCRSPVTSVLVDKAGERLIVSYSDPAIPAATDWLPKRLPKGTGAVLGDTRWEAGAIKLLTLARAANVPGIIDVDRAPRLKSFLAAASHAAFSAQALREYAGTDDLKAALLSLDVPGTWLAVTDGARGVYWREGRRVRHAPGFKVKVVDTLGAGDTWHGAFALALAEGMPVESAVRFSSAAAALKCTRFGGRAGIPDRGQVDRFLTGAGR